MCCLALLEGVEQVGFGGWLGAGWSDFNGRCERSDVEQVIGPLKKDEFIKSLGQFDLKKAFPDQKVGC